MIRLMIAIAAIAGLAGPGTSLVPGGARDAAIHSAHGGSVMVTSAGDIKAGDRIPAPSKEAVLRIGGVGAGNAGAHVTLVDLGTLERLPRVAVQAYDPLTRHEVEFGGVLVSQLLAIAGVPRTTPICFQAAGTTLTLGQPGLDEADAVLATRIDDDAIAPASGGPLRLVFPGASDMAATPSNWLSGVAGVGGCY